MQIFDYLNKEGLLHLIRKIMGRDVDLTQAEYDALPESKNSDGKNYYIYDSDIAVTAEEVGFDGSASGSTAANSQQALDELFAADKKTNESLENINSNLYNTKNPVMLYDISSNSYNANDFLCGNIDMSAYSGFLIYYSDRVGGYQKSSYFTGNMSGMYQALDFTNNNDKHYFAGVQVRGNGLFVELVGANKPFIWRLYGIPA